MSKLKTQPCVEIKQRWISIHKKDKKEEFFERLRLKLKEKGQNATISYLESVHDCVVKGSKLLDHEKELVSEVLGELELIFA